MNEYKDDEVKMVQIPGATLSCLTCGITHLETEAHVYKYLNEDQIDNHLLDPITLQPLINAINLPCGHSFSQEAFETAFTRKNECPQCRKRVKPAEVSAAYALRGLTDNLDVQCPLKCGSPPLTRGLLSTHLQTCPNVTTKCDKQTTANTLCGAIVKRKDLPQHNCVHYWRSAAIHLHQQRQNDNLYYTACSQFESNEEEAVTRLKVGARRGHEMSLFTLAQCYEQGDLSLAIDLQMALELYELAKERGYRPAIKKAEHLRTAIKLAKANANANALN